MAAKSMAAKNSENNGVMCKYQNNESVMAKLKTESNCNNQ
jgi:hypothetical protein